MVARSPTAAAAAGAALALSLALGAPSVASHAPAAASHAPAVASHAPRAQTGASPREIRTRAFLLQYGPAGITSLRRTADVADTEYIAQNGPLRPPAVPY